MLFGFVISNEKNGSDFGIGSADDDEACNAEILRMQHAYTDCEVRRVSPEAILIDQYGGEGFLTTNGCTVSEFVDINFLQ